MAIGVVSRPWENDKSVSDMVFGVGLLLFAVLGFLANQNTEKKRILSGFVRAAVPGVSIHH